MNILLTSAGRRSYLVNYFKEALHGQGMIHASNSAWSPALEVADKAVITPMIYDESYIKFVMDYCLSHDISAVIPLFDIDLPVLSGAKKDFEKKGISLLVSDSEVTHICNDKWETYKFLSNHGFLTPKTFLSLLDCLDSINRRKVSFPLIIKPRWGMGSIGINVAENKRELEVLYKKTKKEITDSYLKYESAAAVNESVVIQAMLFGQEYGLDIINDLTKNYIATLVKRKLAMRSGETDSAVTEYNPILMNVGEKISKHLGHILNLDVDCIYVRENKPYVIEMNCRFGGHYPFSHIAGANLPVAIVKWIAGEVVNSDYFNIEYGVTGYKDMVIKKKKLDSDVQG